jgi:pyruvate dehydrogenase E2 component (dihydrolipoamide acetyltransferase)
MSNTIKAINMPKWGMEMSEGEVTDWHLVVGDHVNIDDELVDVETSKIVNTVTATDSGILRAIIGNTGETLAVGALLGVLADADTPDDEIQAFIASRSAGSVTATDTAAATETAPEAEQASADVEPASNAVDYTSSAAVSVDNSLAELAEGEDDSNTAASAIARRLAKQYGVNLSNISGTGRHGRVSKADLEAAVSAAGGKLIVSHAATNKPAASHQDDSGVKATPVARRIAKQLGINLHDCRQSGDRNRVCKADVEAAAALQNKLQQTPTQQPVEVAAEPFEAQTMSGVRKTIASRLQASKQTAPHFRVQIDAELDELHRVRQRINSANTNAKVSVNDFIVKACASALLAVPAINIQFDGEVVKQFRDADISVAVATGKGLITPIVKAANQKGLMAISSEVRDLATRAKIGRLKPEEFQGGTFCVSNLGMFGIKQFDAIINPPQGAILAVGAGEQRPIIRDGQVVAATVVSLTLSSDHRVIDGAVAAQFMAILKGFLEQPATMLG